jgi:hypothetical protein
MTHVYYGDVHLGTIGRHAGVPADVQVGPGRDRYYDRGYRYDSDRRDRDVTVGVGPGGVRVGPRGHCRMETTTVEREDGRSITRRERRCD